MGETALIKNLKKNGGFRASLSDVLDREAHSCRWNISLPEVEHMRIECDMSELEDQIQRWRDAR